MTIHDIRQRTRNLPIETLMVLLICSLGSLRVAIAVVQDIFFGVRPGEILVDASILVSLLGILYITWRSPLKRIHASFGIILTLLLALNFIQFGGVDGYSKFNYYAGLFILIMIYSHRAMIITVTFHLLTLLVLLVLEHIHHPLLNIFFIHQHPQSYDFWFTLLTLSFFTFYLKEVTIQKGESLTRLNELLRERVRESRKLNRLLAERNETLKKAQAKLESEVTRRSLTLQLKNQAIENFIQTNQQELAKPVQELVNAIDTLDERYKYSAYLKNTARELETITKSIYAKLENNIPLDRQNTRYYEDAT